MFLRSSPAITYLCHWLGKSEGTEEEEEEEEERREERRDRTDGRTNGRSGQVVGGKKAAKIAVRTRNEATKKGRIDYTIQHVFSLSLFSHSSLSLSLRSFFRSSRSLPVPSFATPQTRSSNFELNIDEKYLHVVRKLLYFPTSFSPLYLSNVIIEILNGSTLFFPSYQQFPRSLILTVKNHLSFDDFTEETTSINACRISY